MALAADWVFRSCAGHREHPEWQLQKSLLPAQTLIVTMSRLFRGPRWVSKRDLGRPNGFDAVRAPSNRFKFRAAADGKHSPRTDKPSWRRFKFKLKHPRAVRW